MTSYATAATLRRSRTHDGRPAAERIEELESAVAALRAELARMRLLAAAGADLEEEGTPC